MFFFNAAAAFQGGEGRRGGRGGGPAVFLVNSKRTTTGEDTLSSSLSPRLSSVLCEFESKGRGGVEISETRQTKGEGRQFGGDDIK